MIEKLGIIGGGQMGNGIAHVAAIAGYDVLLLDVDQGRLDAALETSRRIWRARSVATSFPP